MNKLIKQCIAVSVGLFMIGNSLFVYAADMNMDMSHTGHGMSQQKGAMNMGSMSMDSMQDNAMPNNARDPHAFADGYTLDDVEKIPRPVLGDEVNFSSLVIDRLESMQSSDVSAVTYDAQAWFGKDYDRLVMKAEGDIDAGNVQDSSTELFWTHAVSTFWDMQLGARYDSGNGPGKGWLAAGIQGLAPYWFDVETTLYASDKGHTALTLQAEYEWLFTQKLVLQSRFETNFYGKQDKKHDVGAGLSDLAAGLRLRYELRREFSPYIGFEWKGLFGGSANSARLNGEPENDGVIVAGIRFWF